MLEDGTDYQVTIADEQPPQGCTIENASGTVAGADVVDVLVTCEPTPVIERVSIDSAGNEATNSNFEGSVSPSISADNLVTGDTNSLEDVFVGPAR